MKAKRGRGGIREQRPLPNISPARSGTFFAPEVQNALLRNFDPLAKGFGVELALPIRVFLACEGLQFPPSNDWPAFHEVYRIAKLACADVLRALTLYAEQPSDEWSLARRVAHLCDLSEDFFEPFFEGEDGSQLVSWPDLAGVMECFGWNPMIFDAERLRIERSKEKRRREAILRKWKRQIAAYGRTWIPLRSPPSRK